MFVLVTVADTVRIPPPMLAQPTVVSVHREMDTKFPNRVIMDKGLVVCRFGDALQIGDGVIAAGDGGAHHEVVARFVVFRPFVEEVCVGTILQSNEEGITVSVGFFDEIFIPAYWMLRPSRYEEEVGLWVWTPDYGEDEEGDEEGGGAAAEEEEENTVPVEPGSGQDQDDDRGGGHSTATAKNGNERLRNEQQRLQEANGIKSEPTGTNGTVKMENTENNSYKNKTNGMNGESEADQNMDGHDANEEQDETNGEGHDNVDDAAGDDADAGNRFEMHIGAEIRFKVKSINFARVTNTAKGVQATTTMTSHSVRTPRSVERTLSVGSSSELKAGRVRKRSLSVDLSDSDEVPASMTIIASICEDGLGLTSWWVSEEDEGEGEDGGEDGDVVDGEDVHDVDDAAYGYEEEPES